MKLKFPCISRPIIFIILPAVLMLSSGCGSRTAAADKEVKNVRTVKASMSSISIDVEYPGKIKPLEEVVVSPKISGRVSEVKADVGREVEKGQTLFTLETKDADALYKQSQANLDAANANLKRTGGSALSQQVLQAESALKQAQVQYDDAKRLYDKTKALYEGGAASRQQLDDAESRYKSAGIQLGAAGDNLKLLREKAGPQSVDVASAQVEQAQASVAQAAIQLENTVINSPISGVVSIRNVEAGELVSSSIPAFTVINTKILLLEVSIPDKMLGKVSKGQTVPVRISALGNKNLDGIIDTVSPSTDARTQFYTVKVKLDNPDGTVKPGMLARVLLPAEKKENVLTVPNEAVVTENGVQYVYTVADGRIKKKSVNIGLSNDKITEIIKNLNENEAVITEGQAFLNDGDAVSTQ